MPSIILKNYKQFDPQWDMMIGRGTMTMAQGGCGICAIANIVRRNPLEVGRWMEAQGFIYPNEGTVHEGVAITLRHFGVDGEMITPGYVNGQMQSAYFGKAYGHASAGYTCIFLMGGLNSSAGGRCRNSYWTNAGHYITTFMAEDGRMYAYDPASYARDGWHSITDTAGNLTDSYNGNIKKIWLTNQRSTESGGNMVEIPTVGPGSRGKYVRTMQELLTAAGIKGMNGQPLKIDGDAGANTIYAINAYQAIRRSQGVELGTDGHNDDHCGGAMWKDLITG